MNRPRAEFVLDAGASFIGGLSDSSTNGTVTDQEKKDLYGNAVTYAEQNNIQLGTALTQTQINALTQPMLWYVQQTDPDCTATGTDTCPTITALMPQVYLPANCPTSTWFVSFVSVLCVLFG
jgi:filamentous hemagglutinin